MENYCPFLDHDGCEIVKYESLFTDPLIYKCKSPLEPLEGKIYCITKNCFFYRMSLFQYSRYLLYSSQMFSQIKSNFIEWVLSPSTVVSNFTVHCIKAVNDNLPFVPLKLLQNWQNLFSLKNHQQVGKVTFLWTEIAIATLRPFVAEAEYF